MPSATWHGSASWSPSAGTPGEPHCAPPWIAHRASSASCSAPARPPALRALRPAPRFPARPARQRPGRPRGGLCVLAPLVPLPPARPAARGDHLLRQPDRGGGRPRAGAHPELIAHFTRRWRYCCRDPRSGSLPRTLRCLTRSQRTGRPLVRGAQVHAQRRPAAQAALQHGVRARLLDRGAHRPARGPLRQPAFLGRGGGRCRQPGRGPRACRACWSSRMWSPASGPRSRLTSSCSPRSSTTSTTRTWSSAPPRLGALRPAGHRRRALGAAPRQRADEVHQILARDPRLARLAGYSDQDFTAEVYTHSGGDRRSVAQADGIA